MARLVYTKEQLHFLRAFRMFPIDVITTAFNSHFSTNKAQASIQSVYKNHQIPRIRKSPGKNNGIARIYTPERIAWLREHYPQMPIADLAAAYNSTFGANHTKEQLHSVCARRGIRSGRTGRFEKGLAPWNTGKKGYMGANTGSFKKGNMPQTKVRLWTERINRDGYVEISIPERNPWTGAPTRFKHKHLWLWEVENGPLPKGHAVIFRDGNNRNFDSDNLMLVSRAELLLLNLHGYKEAPGELKPTILAIAKLEVKAGFRTTGRHPNAGRKKKVSA